MKADLTKYNVNLFLSDEAVSNIRETAEAFGVDQSKYLSSVINSIFTPSDLYGIDLSGEVSADFLGASSTHPPSHPANIPSDSTGDVPNFLGSEQSTNTNS